MTSRRLIAALALCALAGGALTALQGDTDDPAIRWREDLDAALGEARAAGRPLMIVFR